MREFFHTVGDNRSQLHHLPAQFGVFRNVVLNAIAIGLQFSAERLKLTDEIRLSRPLHLLVLTYPHALQRSLECYGHLFCHVSVHAPRSLKRSRLANASNCYA